MLKGHQTTEYSLWWCLIETAYKKTIRKEDDCLTRSHGVKYHEELQLMTTSNGCVTWTGSLRHLQKQAVRNVQYGPLQRGVALRTAIFRDPGCTCSRWMGLQRRGSLRTCTVCGSEWFWETNKSTRSPGKNTSTDELHRHRDRRKGG